MQKEIEFKLIFLDLLTSVKKKDHWDHSNSQVIPKHIFVLRCLFFQEKNKKNSVTKSIAVIPGLMLLSTNQNDILRSLISRNIKTKTNCENRRQNEDYKDKIRIVSKQREIQLEINHILYLLLLWGIMTSLRNNWGFVPLSSKFCSQQYM